MRRLSVLLMAMLFSAMMCAQTAPLKKVYDEQLNPVEQIARALAEAKDADKFVVCQLGGNWCPWCLRFADFIANDSTISALIADNFVYIHVNYNPRKAADADKREQTSEMLRMLGNPVRFGFPVFVVLDGEGNVLHTQDSSFLEEGEGYDRQKVLRFFRNWTPAAVHGDRRAKQ